MARWSVQKIEIGYVSLNEDGTTQEEEKAGNGFQREETR